MDEEDRGRIDPKQMTLLTSSGLYFVVGTNHREGDRPIFVFGRTLPMSAAVPRMLLGTHPEDYKRLAWAHVQKVASLHVWARTYSELAPGGREQYIHIGKCWPIGPRLMERARAVEFDFTRAEAPLEELSEVIKEVTERRRGNTESD